MYVWLQYANAQWVYVLYCGLSELDAPADVSDVRHSWTYGYMVHVCFSFLMHAIVTRLQTVRLQ